MKRYFGLKLLASPLVVLAAASAFFVTRRLPQHSRKRSSEPSSRSVRGHSRHFRKRTTSPNWPYRRQQRRRRPKDGNFFPVTFAGATPPFTLDQDLQVGPFSVPRDT